MGSNTAQNATTIFLYLIAAVAAIGIFLRLFRKGPTGFVNLLPNIAVSLGILGTFSGIYLGLLEFDVKDISTSIPKLLEGLKTAFITSIAGMIASILLKLIYEFKTVFEGKKEAVQEEDPIRLFKEMVSSIKSLESSSREIEKSIVSCFRSEEEYSLISQLKLVRQEIIDTRKATVESFRDFAEKVAASSTDALVKALESVIKDFNTLLNELVSESFKELSSAMVRLTEWQEKYKDHVDQTENRVGTLLNQMESTSAILERATTNLESIQMNFTKIEKSLDGLSVSAEDVEKHIETLRLQNETLRDTLNSIKDVGIEAKKVIPSISNRIEDLTKILEGSVQKVGASFEENSAVVARYTESAIAKISEASDKHSQTIQSSIEKIDKGLEEELSKALNSIVGSLASLSEKFVEDYLSAMQRSPVKDVEIKALLKQALTDKIDDRALFMKGIDVSYFYEGYSEFKTEEL